jgi:hypothetical protein
MSSGVKRQNGEEKTPAERTLTEEERGIENADPNR